MEEDKVQEGKKSFYKINFRNDSDFKNYQKFLKGVTVY